MYLRIEITDPDGCTLEDFDIDLNTDVPDKVAQTIKSNILSVYEERDYEKDENLDECPECHRKTVRAKSMGEGGGGVECINPDCGYWFFY